MAPVHVLDAGRPGATAAALSALLFALLAVAGEARGADLSGEWRVEKRQTRIKIIDWGLFCGDKPKGHGWKKTGETFKGVPRGSEFVLRSPKESFRSSACNSAIKAMKVKSHTARGDSWNTACEAPPYWRPYENAAYLFQLRDGGQELYYKEFTLVNWEEEGDPCHYTRQIEVVFRRGAEPEEEIELEALDPCDTPGPPRRITLEPKRAKLRPGRQQCFSATARDADGCLLEPEYIWTINGSDEDIDIDARGCLTAPSLGGAKQLSFEIVAAAGSVEGRAKVKVSAARKRRPSVAKSPKPAPVEEAKTEKPKPSPIAWAAEPKRVMNPLEGPRGSVWAWGIGVLLGALLLIGIGFAVLWVMKRRREEANAVAVEPLKPPPTGVRGGALTEEQAEYQRRLEKEAVFHFHENEPELDVEVDLSSLDEAATPEPEPTPTPEPESTPTPEPAAAEPAPLAEAAASGEAARPKGPHCPKCGRSFPKGVRFCPFDRSPVTS